MNAEYYKKRINSLESMLFNLSSLGIDTSEYSFKLKKLNSKFEQLSNIVTHTSGNVAVQSKENNEAMIQGLMKEFNILEEDIKNAYMYFDMCNNCNNINEKANDQTTIEDLNKYSKMLIEFLKYFSQFNHDNYKNYSMAINTIYSCLYKIIKIEIRQTGNSTLLNSLIKNGFDVSNLSNFINEDITNIRDRKDLNKIKEIIEKNPLATNVNIEMLRLIAINEGTYKKDVSKEFKDILKELEDAQNQINKPKNNNLGYDAIDCNVRFSQRFHSSLIGTAIILSNIAFLGFSSYFSNKKLKEKYTMYQYNTTSEYYDTVKGYDTTTTYSEDPKLGNALVKICYPTREDGTRYEEIYLFEKNQYDTVEEYINAEKDEANLIYDADIVDEKANEVSKEQFTSCEIVTDIDENDYISGIDKSSTYKYEIGLSYLMIALVMFFINGFLSICGMDILSEIHRKIDDENLFSIISEYVKNINSLKNNNPKRYRMLKKEIKELNKKYDELMKKYSFMLESIDLNEKNTLKLKKN